MVKEEAIIQNFEAQIPEEEKKLNLRQTIKAKIKKMVTTISGWNWRMIFTGVSLAVLLLFIIILARSVLRVNQFKPPVFPSPSPTPFEEEIINPSAYATDSAVLEIENRLKEIEKDLDETDLKEVGLNLPVLDMEINFEE